MARTLQDMFADTKNLFSMKFALGAKKNSLRTKIDVLMMAPKVKGIIHLQDLVSTGINSFRSLPRTAGRP